jgi:hypothetical protein
MSNRIRVFHAERERSVPVVMIDLGSDGTAVLHAAPVDPEATAFLQALVGSGIDVGRWNPAAPGGVEVVRIEPKDGQAYIDAVADMLGRTSRWIVVPD